MHPLEPGHRTPGALTGLLGHAEAGTAMVYAHVLNRGALGVKSPADRLAARHSAVSRILG